MIRKALFAVALVLGLTAPTTVLAKPSQLAPAPRPTAAAAAPTPNGYWTTYHHDDGHTGNDPAAPAITAVTTGWTSAVLDGQIYAEPLVDNGIVYTATLNNTVYAIDQATGVTIWFNHLGTPQAGGWVCGNVSPQGILGTPVIDPIASRIYAAVEIAGATPTYRLFGLDLASGNIVLNTLIAMPGFDWKIQQERGALAVANGYVYVPFGGRAGDCFDNGGTTPYYGWVVAVPTDGVSSLQIFKTPSGAESVWAAGGVVVDDTSHNVFFATGNAIPCSGSTLSDAIVRMSPTLTSPTFFEPNDWQANWCGPDSDLGSASPVLISPNLMFTAGKHGGGFLLDPTNLGGVDGQRFPTPKPATYSQAEVCFGNHGAATYGSFAYAAPFVYVECEGRGLVALNTNTSTPSFSVCDAACASPDWHVGSGLTFGPPIAAGGAVWVANDGGGLYAYNATTGVQIFHSAGFGVNRFVTPAEAGGQVFVPSMTVIRSFTFAPAPAPPSAPTVSSVAPNSGSTIGGTSVTITGTNFTAATAVKFGTSSAVTGAFVSATQLTATTPPGTSGAVDVTVTTAGGSSATSSADHFTYIAGAYTAVPPVRLLDTRSMGGPIGSGGFRNLMVAGTGSVPAGAIAVVVNVTATNTTAPSFLTVYPAGAMQPLASNLNWMSGHTVSNLVSVQVGAGGAITLFNASGSTDVVVDIQGYFAAPSGLAGGEVPLTPARIADTRPGSGLPNAGSTLGAGATLTIQATGAGMVPTSGVSAVILNITVTNTTAPSFLTVWRTGASRPTTSNLNWTAGQTIPNRVFAQVSAPGPPGGQVSIYNQFGSADVVVDVSGYITDSTLAGKQYTSVSPLRLLDTRTSGPTLGPGAMLTLQVRSVAGVPSGATAVILNVTVTNTSAPSFLTVYPSTAARPTASDLNWVGGQTVPNMVVATLGTTGALTFYNLAGAADVVVDLAGWY